MNKNKAKQEQQARRHNRVRAKIKGTPERPRLSFFRYNNGMFLQLVDDLNHKTLASAGSKEIKAKTTKTDLGQALGLLIAEKAKAIKIDQVVFDRSSYRYHGRVKAVAEGARTGGLKL